MTATALAIEGGIGAVVTPVGCRGLSVLSTKAPASVLTSCAIKEARSGNFTPPGTIWVQGGAGLGVVRGGPTWPLGRWVRWPVSPTGTGAGSSSPPPCRRLPAGG
jgi:hypothetical protein